MKASQLIHLFLAVRRGERHSITGIAVATQCSYDTIIDVVNQGVAQGAVVPYWFNLTNGYYYTQLPPSAKIGDFVCTYQKVG